MDVIANVLRFGIYSIHLVGTWKPESIRGYGHLCCWSHVVNEQWMACPLPIKGQFTWTITHRSKPNLLFLLCCPKLNEFKKKTWSYTVENSMKGPLVAHKVLFVHYVSHLGLIAHGKSLVVSFWICCFEKRKEKNILKQKRELIQVCPARVVSGMCRTDAGYASGSRENSEVYHRAQHWIITQSTVFNSSYEVHNI